MTVRVRPGTQKKTLPYGDVFFLFGVARYPITTSSTIISTKPIAKPMVLRLEC